MVRLHKSAVSTPFSIPSPTLLCNKGSVSHDKVKKMNATKRDNHRAALVLVYATLHGDSAAAEEYNINIRTVKNYRHALNNDEVLALTFQEMLEGVTNGWVASLRGTLQQSARWLNNFITTIDMTELTPKQQLEYAKEVRLIFKDLSNAAIMREALVDEPAGANQHHPIPEALQTETTTERFTN